MTDFSALTITIFVLLSGEHYTKVILLKTLSFSSIRHAFMKLKYALKLYSSLSAGQFYLFCCFAPFIDSL